MLDTSKGEMACNPVDADRAVPLPQRMEK